MVKLIGGIGLSTVNIYDQIAAGDNVGSGCAHVHGIAEEAYLGLKGHGAIDLHDLKNGYRRVIITEGTFVQFPPWTMHRAVNLDNSQVLVIMGKTVCRKPVICVSISVKTLTGTKRVTNYGQGRLKPGKMPLPGVTNPP